MKDLFILNAKLVNEGQITEEDLFIKNGRIEKIGGALSPTSSDIVLDAAGKHLFPGMIDDQVHFREPGHSHKADFFTESRAALSGGITSVMDMPNTNPPTTENVRIREKLDAAKGRFFTNYAFYLGATNNNVEEIKRLQTKEVCGVKVFMGSSTGNMLVDKEDVLHGIFEHSPVLIATHCEDSPTIQENETKFRATYQENVPFECHPKIRSEEACYKSSSFAVSLANAHPHAHLHVLHLSTEKELSLFSSDNIENKNITVEACAHHLFFDDSFYKDNGSKIINNGSFIKCNPAIKTLKDKEALLNAVKSGKIDVIGTDHAPHTRKEKENNYFNAPSGLPLVQHAFVSLLEHYHNGIFSLELIAEKTSHSVAKLFQIEERGFIREGYWADLTLVDLSQSCPVTTKSVLYKCGWSPFEGLTFRSSIIATVVSGVLSYRDGEFLSSPAGLPLYFNRY